MKPLLLALPKALALTGAAAAQIEKPDSVKKDGDPVVVGAPANPDAGPDTAAEAAVTTPAARPAAATEAPATPTTAAPSTPTRLYAAPAAPAEGTVVSNGPVPDTPENRARYGGPNSRAGKLTAPRGD